MLLFFCFFVSFHPCVLPGPFARCRPKKACSPHSQALEERIKGLKGDVERNAKPRAGSEPRWLNLDFGCVL